VAGSAMWQSLVRQVALGHRPPASLPEPLAFTYRCRVCGHEGGRGDFCPRCLAGTMERKKGT